MLYLTHLVMCVRRRLAAAEHERNRGSAAVEYVGLALVVSMLMASLASAVDSAMGERFARAVLTRLVGFVSGE